MTKVLVPVADGSEEMETVILVDILRRAKFDVQLASVMSHGLNVNGSRGVSINADVQIADCCNQEWDLIVLPGGMPGAEHLQACAALIELLKTQLSHGRWTAAICASPAVVLGRNALIGDYCATCYPSFQQELAMQVKAVKPMPVVVDNNLITSQGPGTAAIFALTLIDLLVGEAHAKSVAEGLLVEYP